jgi:hypothetical protein
MMEKISLCYDAFSNGQIDSKIWLCDELEKIINVENVKIWILGGWYSTTAFLLLSRNKMSIDHIRSFDIDPECQAIADRINNNWEIKEWKFKAFTKDCNKLDYSIEPPDIVINTSTEHFDSLEWFERIPVGTLVCLQGNNMNHEDHFSIFENLSQFKKSFPLSSILFEGEKDFVYPDWKFNRYMLIGIK